VNFYIARGGATHDSLLLHSGQFRFQVDCPSVPLILQRLGR
jgi:hypothetical protein